MFPDNAAPFIAARDLLLRRRTDYEAAVREFRWPVMDRFNWALDYFDHLPPDPLALWCIGAVGPRSSRGRGRSSTRRSCWPIWSAAASACFPPRLLSGAC